VNVETPFFAGSAGGHLDLLEALAPQVLRGREPVWVTARSPRGEALSAAAADVLLLPEYGRSPLKALRNLLTAARVAIRRRPRVVVTSGAGVVAPFCILARLGGARLIYLETMARVSHPSMTARLLSRLAERVIVQWPELAEQLPRATVCRPTLLEGLAGDDAAGGAGTFVAVGTDRREYTRMLEIVARAIEAGLLPSPVLAQAGPAQFDAAGAEVVPYMTTEEIDSAVERSAVVVCHGGAGIISTALNAGRTPIVIPRRAELGEHVDDHQYQLTHKLADWDLVVPVDGEITPTDIERAQRAPRAPEQIDEHPPAAHVLRGELAA
jgi:UDP-N-acetylglucosamine--N-acetylmuramyl-(pentapeptide) pyrophosphoryl-undecaprenol N-acetylglucosamine transferase